MLQRAVVSFYDVDDQQSGGDVRLISNLAIPEDFGEAFVPRVPPEPGVTDRVVKASTGCAIFG